MGLVVVCVCTKLSDDDGPNCGARARLSALEAALLSLVSLDCQGRYVSNSESRGHGMHIRFAIMEVNVVETVHLRKG
jgi:hypothetical protein